ncbi:PAS domain S-box protein [Prolixibacter sp. NT017]|uniref:PAS domain S-box protein n=1 Tax=Prolixibacter sp. NT017 TaxID=2652390 RepID=UPI0012803163|nr:PAS domain S-box protein [Prolixibacter sp. NT017]GET25170.1 hypothetical protein NT017_14990 [Prolixibacter sp. NT017]
MNNSIVVALLQNTAILLAFSMLYDYLWVGEENSKKISDKLITGVILGAIGIILMLSQWTMKPGLVFDTRSVMLSISGVFFGLVPTVIAMIATGVFRILEGGAGLWMGIAVIISSGTIGILWRELRPNWFCSNQLLELLSLGVVVHMSMLACSLLLPASVRWETLSQLALPLLTVYPIGNVLLGKLMLKQNKNWQTRNALHESEEKYRTLVEGAGDTIVILQDGLIQFANHMISQAFGYGRNEVLNRNFLEFIAPSERTRLEQYYIARTTGKDVPTNYETVIQHKDGQLITVELTASTLTYNRRPAHMMFVRDITERKEAKLRLENERKQLKTLFETIPDLIWLKDKEGRFLSCNHEFERLMGVPVEELFGKTDYDFFPADLATFFREKDKVAIEEDEAQTNLEWVTYADDGHDALFETIKTPMRDSEGNLIGVLGVARNMTDFYRTQEALKESERKLKEAQTLAQIGHWELDIESMHMHFSEAIGKIIELDDEILKISFDKFLQLIHPDDRERVKNSYVFSEPGKKYSEVTHRLLLKNDKIKHIEQRYITEYNAQGHPVRRHGTLQDITREVLTGLELLRAKEKAEESDRLKSIFLANMSHEIRTPMNAIMGFSNLLGELEPDDPERDNFIDIIQNSSKRLLQIINDIVDISKIEAGQLRINKTDCEPAKLLENSYRTFEKSAWVTSNPNLDLMLELPEDAAAIRLHTDGIRVQQVIDNLMSNALKFTQDGSVTIGFVQKQTEDGNFIEFYVKDTGLGISSEKAEIIFERFRQIDEDKHHEGAGLGLSISKGIVELLGGSIWFTSQPNIGTTFSFTVPYQPVKETLPEWKKAGSEVDEFQGLSIIIAEDDRNSYMYLRELLKNRVSEIKHASNGQILMDMLEQSQPDLVLLDIDMPVKSGYECLQEIKEKGITTRIIAQTAYAMLEERDQLLEAGCHGYIAKPIKKAELYEAIGEVMKTAY